MSPKGRTMVLDLIDQRSNESRSALCQSLQELATTLDGGAPIREIRDEDSVVTSMDSLRRHVSKPESAVLFVDDEQPNRYAFKYALDDHFRVLTASSGKEALEILDREQVGVLVTDQRMSGMTGVELCKAVHKKHPSIPLVVISAYSDKQVLIDAINEVRIRYFLPKPWNTERLIALLKDIMVPEAAQATIVG